MKTLQHTFKTEDQFLKALDDSQIIRDHPHILVQLFAGNQNNKQLQQLLDFITDIMPRCIVTGATTDGEILNDQVLEERILISVHYFDRTRLQIEKTDNQSANFLEEGVHLGRKLRKKDLKAALLFAEGLSVNGEDLLTGFESQVGDIVIAGGLAADNNCFEQTYVLYQNKILDTGAVAVGLYSDTLRIKTKLAFDCDIMSREFVITESTGNIVQKIDNMTPEALYTQYLNLQKNSQLIEICAQIPMIVKREGRMLARAPVNRYPDGFFSFGGNLIAGEKVRFGIVSEEKMLDNAVAIFNEIKSQWDAIHIYSCSGRKRILGDRLAQDIQHFSKIAPVNGFFSYGEFVKEKGKKALFCNETMVLLFLSESEKCPLARTVRISRKNIESVKKAAEENHHKNEIAKEPGNLLLREHFILVEHKNKIKEQLLLAKHKNKIMKEMLYQDALTGLKNRNALLQKIENKKNRGVMLIDIRNFHAINDLYGEEVGNIILKSFADFLKKQFEPDNIYRLSGNTFAILNIYNHSQKQCQAIAQKISRDVQRENFSFKKEETMLECALSVTIGVSNKKEKGNHLEHADMALNYAKKYHKSIVIYNDSLNIKQRYEQDISIIKMVKKALDDDRIVPYFQPVFKGTSVSYYEALIRIIGEDGSVFSPIHFLDVIKHTTYYPRLTRRMIRKSFELFDQQEENMLAINLSFLDFSHTETMEYLFEMIRRYDMGKKLILEILESEVFQDYETTIEQIRHLRSLGAKIAIDDFGSGYSNFLHLTLIDPDYIKIDGALIRNIDTDAKSRAVCKAIISFAKDLNIKTIAEFIDSKEILAITTRLKIDKHQGFYLGKPRKAEDLFIT